MRVLLDTHAFLWANAAPERLSPAMRSTLAAPATLLHVSVLSAWELAIAQGLGRIDVAGTVDEFFMRGVAALGMRLLPLQLSHIAGLRDLPPLHRDPFDRMLVATARAEGLVLATADAVLARYGVPVVW